MRVEFRVSFELPPDASIDDCKVYLHAAIRDPKPFYGLYGFDERTVKITYRPPYRKTIHTGLDRAAQRVVDSIPDRRRRRDD